MPCVRKDPHARQAKATELIQYATEINARAERRCGELLSVMEKRDGGDAMKARSNPSTAVPPTLADTGLTRDQSSRYQQLAAKPEEHLETAVATAKGIESTPPCLQLGCIRSARGVTMKFCKRAAAVRVEDWKEMNAPRGWCAPGAAAHRFKRLGGIVKNPPGGADISDVIVELASGKRAGLPPLGAVAGRRS